MRIVIVHNAVSASSTPDDQDVLVQTDTVSEVLRTMGHNVKILPCHLDLASIKRRLVSLEPDLVFNLVESLDGRGCLIHLFPALLDAMGIPYTGSQTDVIWMTSHKVMAKRHMRSSGISTPAWLGPCPKDATTVLSPEWPPSVDGAAQNWIIKSLWEHASVGLEVDSIIHKLSGEDIYRELSKRVPRIGACFAEEYIHGREFNLSILTGPDGPQVLPPAEIVFQGFDPSRPLIVGYRAKWETDSFEYQNTLRRFNFKSEDKSLLATLTDLALRCWHIFRLRGYARVDFRVDNIGNPWVLEINANPCISPDAGFAAAVKAAGIDFKQALERIIRDGMMHHSDVPYDAAATS